MKSRSKLLEELIDNCYIKLLYDEAALKSIEIQRQEHKSSIDDFQYQKTKNDILNSMELDERMLKIYKQMLKKNNPKVKYES